MAEDEASMEDLELEEELDGDLDDDFDDESGGDDVDATTSDDEDAEDGEAEGVEIPSGTNPAADDDVHLGEDDVEASLDIILKEKLVVDEEVDEEAAAEPEPVGDGTEQVQPRQADEFVCKSCFLVKSTNQLADRAAGLCRDCV